MTLMHGGLLVVADSPGQSADDADAAYRGIDRCVWPRPTSQAEEAWLGIDVGETLATNFEAVLEYLELCRLDHVRVDMLFVETDVCARVSPWTRGQAVVRGKWIDIPRPTRRLGYEVADVVTMDSCRRELKRLREVFSADLNADGLFDDEEGARKLVELRSTLDLARYGLEDWCTMAVVAVHLVEESVSSRLELSEPIRT